MTPTGVRHVLFDADGVLQFIPGGWYASMQPYLGDRVHEFMQKTWADELPALAGKSEYMPLLQAALLEYGVVAPIAEVYAAVWHNISVVEETFSVVDALRRAGFGVHLGTNQERHRAEYMRTSMGYGKRFDVSCYSCELGVAKPDAEFFVEAAALIGADAATILFIDDNTANVDSARSAGLAAEQWDHLQGIDVLVGLLAAHSIIL
jgi:putative hydrolase of the HAD superfamily